MKSVCIVVQNYYDTDPRVRREAEALVNAGYKVDILSLMPPSKTHRSYQLNGVDVFTIQVSKSRQGKWSYLREYLTFLLLASFWLAKRTFHQRYDIVQVCTLPDFLVLATLVPKLFGAKILLDMHEVMPEFYISKYKVPENHWMIRLMKWQERVSTTFADHILTINEPIRQLLIIRGLKPEKITIIMNSADETVFKNTGDKPISDKDAPFIMMYHGTLTHIYGLDIAIRALKIAHDVIPDAELWIIGDGPEIDYLKSLTLQLSLKDEVKFIGTMPQQEIPAWLAKCSVGILPTRKDIFLDLSFSNKLPEYIIMKKPVIVSRLKTISFYFSEDSLGFFEPENENDLVKRIIELRNNAALRQSMVVHAEDEYTPIKWDIMKSHYIDLISSL